MELKTLKIKSIHPYERNARKNDQAVDAVAKSIEQCSYAAPIVVDENHVILAGHTRWKALKKLGRTECECIVKDGLTEEQKKKYRLLDNKTNELADWDFDLLADELDGLDFGDLKLDWEIEERQEEKEVVEDDYEVEIPEEPKAKLGQVYRLGSHRLMCGDSTKREDVERLMDGIKADMVFTDPPYGVSYSGGHNKKKRKGIENDELQGENLTGLFYFALKNAIEFTERHAAFYVWYASGKSIETYESLSNLPLELRAVIQWYKVHSGLGAFMAQYIPNCEPCIYAHKKGQSPQWFGPTNEKTVWEQKRDGKNDLHPTQKPVELSIRALNNSSKPGDCVMDLFGGSGSTMIACEQLNRKCYMMELDPKYVDVIIGRWEQFTEQKAVLIEEV